MKINKKIMSLILSFVMLFSVVVSTSDTSGSIIDVNEKGSLTIKKYLGEEGDVSKPLEGAGFTLYRVGTIEQSTTGDIGISYKSLVTDVTITSNTTAKEFEGKTLPAESGYIVTDLAGNASINNLELGIYLVKETKTPSGVTVGNDFLVSIPMSMENGWLYDLFAEPKNAESDASINKEVVDGYRKDKEGNNTVTVGANVSYKINMKLPTDLKTTAYNKLNIVDTPNSSLKVDTETIKVLVGENELAKGVDYNILPNGNNGFIVELLLTSSKLTPGANIIVTYDAKVLTTANPGEALENNAQIEYKTDKGEGTINQAESIVPEKPTPVYTYSYRLKKVKADESALSGAEFAIKAKDNQGNEGYLKYDETNGWSVVALEVNASKYISGEDGIVEFKGLEYGEYTLIETKAPTGYSLLKDGIQIVIDKSTTEEAFSTTVVNKETGITLPETGGKGIMMLIVGGLTLVGISIVLLKKSKKNTDK